MTDEEQHLRGRIARSERARAIIEDPLLVEAFDRLEAVYIDGWRVTQSDDTAGREALWHRIKALSMLRADLASVLQDGTVARYQLAELTEPSDDQP